MSLRPEVLIGETMVEVERLEESLIFKTSSGKGWVFHHCQDCCESVTLEDICGDLADLVGTPILLAEEVTNQQVDREKHNPPNKDDSFTWTFYKFGTIKGYVTVRWLGQSNGYYGEGVDLDELQPAKEQE